MADGEKSFGLSEVGAVLGIAFAGGMIATGSIHVSHDVAVLAEVGDRIVAGQVPYVDYVETNPPLSHYLNAVAAALGAPLGVPTHWTLIGLAWLGLVACAGALWSGLTAIVGARDARRAAAAFVWVSVFVAAVGNFAQREHLFVLLYVPFLVHRIRAVRGLGHAAAGIPAGVLGAVGVCIKPHFVVTAALVELVLLASWWRNREGRFVEPGLVAWVVTGLLYPLHFLVLPGAMTSAFFEVWAPVLVEGYRAYGDPELAYRTLAVIWIPVGAACLGVWAGPLRAVGAAAVGAFLVYFLQWKGWFYHLIPAMAFASIGLAPLVGRAVERQKLVIRFCLGWVALVVAALAVRGNAVPDGGEARQAFETHLSAGDRVVVWATDLSPAYPWLALQGVERIGRYPVVFPLPVLWPDGVSAFAAQPETDAEATFRADLATDLDAAPDWLLLDEADPCAHCGPGVSMPRYVEHIGLRTRIEAEYERVVVVDGLGFWKRRP